MALISAAMTLLINRLLYEYDARPCSVFKDSPHGRTRNETARSAKVPHNMLRRQNQLQRKNILDNFMAVHTKQYRYPRSRFKQEFGLIISTAIASHHNRVNTLKPTSHTDNLRINYNPVSTVSVTTNSSLLVIHKTITDWQMNNSHTQPLSRETTMTNLCFEVGNLSQDTLGEHFSSTEIQTFSARQQLDASQTTDVNMATGSNQQLNNCVLVPPRKVPALALVFTFWHTSFVCVPKIGHQRSERWCPLEGGRVDPHETVFLEQVSKQFIYESVH